MKQAVQWLKQNKGMLQKDIAEKMGITEVAFSNGMKRIQIKWDEDFVIKFQQSTGEIFSLDWLLNGTGDKFADKSKTQEPQPVTTNVDFASYINALLAKSDETIASLKREIAAKDDVIQAKNERIATLEQLAEERLHRIAELRRYIDENNISMTDHPFPIGAADDTKQSRKRV
jgi:transcriptional regulator with XRE-family HTH domain